MLRIERCTDRALDRASSHEPVRTHRPQPLLPHPTLPPPRRARHAPSRPKCPRHAHTHRHRNLLPQTSHRHHRRRPRTPPPPTDACRLLPNLSRRHGICVRRATTTAAAPRHGVHPAHNAASPARAVHTDAPPLRPRRAYQSLRARSSSPPSDRRGGVPLGCCDGASIGGALRARQQRSRISRLAVAARQVHGLQPRHVEERARARTARFESDECRPDRVERHRRVAQDLGASAGTSCPDAHECTALMR